LLAIQEYGLQVHLKLDIRKVKVPTLDPSDGKRDHHPLGGTSSTHKQRK
jgi:hypothetical protein